METATPSGKPQRSSFKSAYSLESLENRVLLHAAVFHIMPADLQKYIGDDGHIKASDFLKARPQFVGKNLWVPATFNPRNSADMHDWLYDPHWIADDFPQAKLPVAPAAPAGGPEVATLPDLVPLTGGQFLNPFIDNTEVSGHSLLRFTTGIGNQGSGPAILTSANSGTSPLGTPWINPDGTQNVLQMIYDYNAGTNQFSFNNYREAGHMVWHPGHGHFHLEGYAQYRLLTNVAGQPGPVALRSGYDNAPAVGDKVGFCLVNIMTSFTMTNGQPSTTLPGYDPVGDQSHSSNNGQPLTTCGFTQGIHVGHADVYNSIYDGQWVDVTGVPAGNYFLEVTLDALNVIQETNDANNTVIVPVTLNNNPPTGGIQPDRFEPNNDFASATDLGTLGVQTQSGLTIHVTNENDYFKFVAASSGTYSVQLTIADRDVNLYVYDGNQTLLGASTSAAVGTQQNPSIETVTTNFVVGQTYYVRAVGFGSALNPVTSGVSNNYALTVSVNPTINASTPDGLANEFGPDNGRISIQRNGPTSSPLAVNFTVSGTATRGVDYDIYQGGFLIAGNSVTIGNESASAELDIVPITDHTPEPTETVTITLNTNAAYVIGAGTAGTVNIGDSGPAVSTTTQIWQTSPHKLIFNILRAQAASIALADFTVLNTDTNQPVTPQNLSVVDNGNGSATATMTFNGVLPDGHYRATILAGSISNAQGDVNFADIPYNFFTMTADANHDAVVNVNDFTILASNFGLTGRDASQGDFNYDGVVNVADFTILASRFGTALSAPGARARGIATGPSALRGMFADGKGIDETQRQLLALLA